MKCQEIQCGKRFCELCHPECRYSKGNSFRFDSGKGLGPFCRKCITAKRKEEERAERVVRERAEKERKREEEKRREREYLEGVERAKKERKREEEGIRKRERERVEREETAERTDKASQAENQKKAEAKRLEWERGRGERERASESSKLWKTAAIHASIQNDIHKKRLMYSLLLGILVSILFSALIDVPIIGGDNVMMVLSVVMGTLCFFYPLYLITMIIICWLTGTKKHYVKLLNQSNVIREYKIMVEELSLLTVAELRDKLSEVGLSVDTNKKADLISRLADYEVRTKEGLLLKKPEQND